MTSFVHRDLHFKYFSTNLINNISKTPLKSSMITLTTRMLLDNKKAKTVLISVPPSTDQVLVFPLDIQTQSFDSKFYSPNFTDCRASPEEISQILSQLTTIWSSACSKAKSAKSDMDCMNLIAFFVCFLLLFAIYVISPLFLILFIILQRGSYNDKLSKISKDCNAQVTSYIDVVNQDFMMRGLKWHIPTSFPYWIELWKDYAQGSLPNYTTNLDQQYYQPPYVSNFNTTTYQQGYYQC